MADDEESSAADEGDGIVNLSWAITGAFAAAAVAAAIAPDTLGVPAAVLDGIFFVVGLVAFLWAYGIAVGRSRTDEIGIGGLYFLMGTAPKRVRLRLLGALGVQVVVAIVTASIPPYTAVAFGILVPMAGLGLTGLWGARYGQFAERGRPGDDDAGAEVPADESAG